LYTAQLLTSSIEIINMGQ